MGQLGNANSTCLGQHSARRLAQANLLAELSELPIAKGRLCFELLETISFNDLQPVLEEIIPAVLA
jgi:hypothetical protein